LGHKAIGATDSLDPSKIHGTTNKIFNNETVDLIHVSERTQPLGYFLKADELVFEIL
jgi:hypothetical protein